MKFSKLFFRITLAIGLALAVPARAQMTIFQSLRTIVISNDTVLTAANANLTNGPVDLHSYIGQAYIDLHSCTNAGGALTSTIQTSPDLTNWYALTNFALINSTTQFSYTNGIYGNIAVSSNYLLPGTIATSTPGNSSNAFAGTWLNYLTVPFTNSGAVTVTAKGTYRVGFKIADQPGRYLQVYWTPTGSSSNDTVSSTLTGNRATEVQ